MYDKIHYNKKRNEKGTSWLLLSHSSHSGFSALKSMPPRMAGGMPDSAAPTWPRGSRKDTSVSPLCVQEKRTQSCKRHWWHSLKGCRPGAREPAEEGGFHHRLRDKPSSRHGGATRPFLPPNSWEPRVRGARALGQALSRAQGCRQGGLPGHRIALELGRWAPVPWQRSGFLSYSRNQRPWLPTSSANTESGDSKTAFWFWGLACVLGFSFSTACDSEVHIRSDPSQKSPGCVSVLSHGQMLR